MSAAFLVVASGTRELESETAAAAAAAAEHRKKDGRATQPKSTKKNSPDVDDVAQLMDPEASGCM